MSAQVKARTALQAYWDTAQRKMPQTLKDVPMPELEFSNRMTATAGLAYSSLNLIKLSAKLLEENQDSFIQDTIPHELAHILADNYYDSKGHDDAWKHVCYMLTGRILERCHDYAIQRKTAKTIAYKCACRQWDFTPQRIAWIRKGKIYFCKDCKTNITKA